jgi:catechol 2,3-dioxygenase-like lactoylglutathione lyase family enzyme
MASPQSQQWEQPMIHHVSLGTNDVARARTFYDPIMALLGFRRLKNYSMSADYGVGEIQFSVETPVDGKPASVGNGVHICFQALDRGMVREFHRLALELGGTDDGSPGIRAQYDDHYYGAFVRDPDGNKVEAVTMSAK